MANRLELQWEGRANLGALGQARHFKLPRWDLKTFFLDTGAQPGSNPATLKKNIERIALHPDTTLTQEAAQAARIL